MVLKFTVTKQSDPSYTNNHEFNRFPIFLGRDEKNEVTLPDPFKIISRKHAKIIETEGIFQLIDLDTPNFTYLNDEKIISNEEYAIKSGDKIKIGDFEISLEFSKEKDVIVDDEKTMVFLNPFAEEVASITESLKKLSAKFTLDDSPIKTDMLKFSLSQNLGEMNKDETSKIIAEYFSENFLNKKVSVFKEVIEPITPVSKISSASRNEVNLNPVLSPDYSFSSHFTNTIDVLLETFGKLIQGFLHFRQEFFGITIYHSIPTGSLSELKEYLFNPGISSEEEKKRLNLLNEEIQKLLTHQLGLLEGYQTSITEGSKSLLQSLDPELIEKELQSKQKSGLDIGRILPITQKSKILDTIKENYQKYMSDPYHIEKKYFRPAFMKGYQIRLSSKKQINEY